MTNPRIATLEDVRDVESLNYYAGQIAAGRSPFDVLAAIDEAGRDNARTPMQWDATAHAGFTAGTPWMPVNPNHAWLNAAAEYDDPASVFNLYRRLIELRKRCPTVVDGDFTMLLSDHPHLYAFTRRLGDHELVVVANLGDAVQEWPTEIAVGHAELVLGNYLDSGTGDEVAGRLQPWEARVLGR